MLSYVVRDLATISELYPDLSPQDEELVTDSVQFGGGVRVYRDGSLIDAQTGEAIVESLDEDLIDEGDFESEADAANSELEDDEGYVCGEYEEGDTISVIVDDLELTCVVVEDDEGDDEDGEEEDTLGMVVDGVELACVPCL